MKAIRSTRRRAPPPRLRPRRRPRRRLRRRRPPPRRLRRSRAGRRRPAPAARRLRPRAGAHRRAGVPGAGRCVVHRLVGRGPRRLHPPGRRHDGGLRHAEPAPVSGTVELNESSSGGLAWYLHGDDGNTYYGAHLSGYGAASGTSPPARSSATSATRATPPAPRTSTSRCTRAAARPSTRTRTSPQACWAGGGVRARPVGDAAGA